MSFRTSVPVNALLAYLGLMAVAADSGAAGITISVTDRDRQAVERVIVYAVANDAVTPPHEPRAMGAAAMDQRERAFVPHMLVVETGTEIDFPNSDNVSHHVYSFSAAKSFELPLYKGTAHPPLRFDEPGIVILGCNIHDDMLGYIVVLDTPYFALTDANGEARFESLPAGDYTVHAWTPRVRPDNLPTETVVTIHDASNARLAFEFTKKLYPRHEHEETSLTWSKY